METKNWYEVKIRFEKLDESGVEKKVTESYVVAAESFGDAEERAVENLSTYVSGELQVVGITPLKIQESLVGSERFSRFYKVVLSYVWIDEKSGKEKKRRMQYLVNAPSFDSCKDLIRKYMELCMIDYQIVSVSETKYMDVV